MAQDLTGATASASLEAIREALAGTKVSTSTLNFVVWIDDPKRRRWILERTRQIAEKHPSFTLVFDASGAAAGGTTVATPEHEPHVTVRGEQVVVDAAGFDAAAIGEYVATLSRASVPVVVWWTATRFARDPRFEALVAHADDLVVDSAGGAHDDATLRDVAALHAARPDVPLRDLAWLRLGPWLEMFAHAFDDEERVRQLFTIRSLRISSGSDAEALYLAGWLASRLGWTVSDGAFVALTGERIAVEIRREGAIRRIRSVCVETAQMTATAEVTDDPETVRITRTGDGATTSRLEMLSKVDTPSLVERAILDRAHDELFTTALADVAALVASRT